MKQIHRNAREAASYKVANLLLRADRDTFGIILECLFCLCYAYIIQFDYTKLLTKSQTYFTAKMKQIHCHAREAAGDEITNLQLRRDTSC